MIDAIKFWMAKSIAEMLLELIGLLIIMVILYILWEVKK